VRFDNPDPAGSGGSGSSTTGTASTSGSMGSTATTSASSGSYGSSTFTVGSAGGATPGTGGGATGGAGAAGGPPLICPPDLGACYYGCPEVQPATGSSCATTGQTCPYPFCGSATVLVACVAGRWSTQTFPPCNPPPPAQPCPAVEPTAGSFCGGFLPPTCSYPVLCCGVPRGQHAYECTLGNVWRATKPDGGEADSGGCYEPPPSCPSIAPYDGEPCCFNAPMAGACFYGCSVNPDGGSLFSPTAFCDGKQWRVSYASCPLYEGTNNPPGDSSWRGPFDGGGGEESGPD
jgi:hypothetical protein